MRFNFFKKERNKFSKENSNFLINLENVFSNKALLKSFPVF